MANDAGGGSTKGPNRDEPPLTREELHQKPWKYKGYKDFTRHISSAPSDDFLALRRFDRAHCRLLLMLQDQVSELEAELDSVDARLSRRSAPDIDNGSIRNDPSIERKELLERLHKKIKEYDELLVDYTILKSQPRASKRSVKNIRAWLQENDSPIHPLEVEFLDHASDLSSPAKSRKPPLRRLLETCITLPARLLGLGPDGVEPETVETLTSIIMMIVAAGMLLGPLWILATIAEEPFDRLVTVTGFLLLFLVVLTGGTDAGSYEVVAGAGAVYSVVLVVFLQVGPGIMGEGGGSKFFDL